MIYFVRSGDLVKIGKTKNLKMRLRELQRFNSHELRVIVTIPGRETQERKLHDLFADRRVKGEWFSITDEEAIAAAAEFSANQDNYPPFTPTEFAGFLSSVLSYAADAGLSVGVRQSEATGTRPAGLLVFVSGLSIDADGRLIALDPAPTEE